MDLAPKVVDLWIKKFAPQADASTVERLVDYARSRETASRKAGKTEVQVAKDIVRQIQFVSGLSPRDSDIDDATLMKALGLDQHPVFNEAVRVYVRGVLTELRKDDEFIRSLKATRVRSMVPISNIERFVDEWAASQKGIKPNEVQVARRLAVERFPDLFDKFRGDPAAAKKALFSMLNAFTKKRIR